MKLCCQQAQNLDEKPSGRPDLTIRVCRICQCRHFEAVAEAGTLGLVLKGL